MQIVLFFSGSTRWRRLRHRMFVHIYGAIEQFMMTSRHVMAMELIEQHVMEIQNANGFFIKTHWLEQLLIILAHI